ncbi:DUF2892 domain-containing protein [Azoarcus indigens]|uniref:DUF2892 family protein n=1 Tax=Azoarcus indigens TaxID=29545 RepID=A0A4R6ECR1_9RHOO|nr:DUF2892 domain-containing protein [Azoarcus indigens]NMG65905.1 DUF2892 domain-containing protein [Azoarcus indigens]TDN55945.1 hypothetical protein C7389_103283 [Azoarcus indigens]
MLPSTQQRVPLHTATHVNRHIREQARASVQNAALGGLPGIDRRLAELDREWDVERVLEANAASLVVAGCALGAFADRRFFVVPALVGGFLLQHALQGWCPPLPLLRRLGIRTEAEIEDERRALLASRADVLAASRVGPAGRAQ